MKSQLSRIHWVVPATMVGALLLGLLFAVGHHLFYSSLAGTRPPIAIYKVAGSSFSGQELNTAVGTTFALLVRSCLVLAISLSYIQLVWYAVKSSGRELTVADMDKVTSALGNLLVVFNVFAWWRWPLVLLTAAVSWYRTILQPYSSGLIHNQVDTTRKRHHSCYTVDRPGVAACADARCTKCRMDQRQPSRCNDKADSPAFCCRTPDDRDQSRFIAGLQCKVHLQWPKRNPQNHRWTGGRARRTTLCSFPCPKRDLEPNFLRTVLTL